MKQSDSWSLPEQACLNEKLILARGIFEQKERIVVATVLAILIMCTLVFFSGWTHELNSIDAIVATVLSVGYGVGMLFMVRMSDERLYNALYWWTVVTLIVICSLLFNELHGSRRLLVAESSYPYVIAYVPLEVLFIHAFVVPRVAWKMTFAFVFTCAVIVLVPPLFYDGRILITSGTIWTLICVTVVPLLAAVLAHMNQSNHSEVLRAVMLEEQRLEQEGIQLEKAEITDSLTGGLNEAGIRRRLKANLESNPNQFIAMLQVVADRIKRSDDSTTLQRIASHVEHLLGENTCWGRMHDTVFVVWRPGVGEAELEDCLAKMPLAFSASETIVYSITALTKEDPDRSLNPEFDLLIEAENKLFIHAMR